MAYEYDIIIKPKLIYTFCQFSPVTFCRHAELWVYKPPPTKQKWNFFEITFLDSASQQNPTFGLWRPCNKEIQVYPRFQHHSPLNMMINLMKASRILPNFWGQKKKNHSNPTFCLTYVSLQPLFVPTASECEKCLAILTVFWRACDVPSFWAAKVDALRDFFRVFRHGRSYFVQKRVKKLKKKKNFRG